MYSRYKIQIPAPPPDYAGTAFQSAQIPDSIGNSTPNPPPENPEQGKDSSVFADFHEIAPANPTTDVPDREIDPDFTIPPSEKFPEYEPETEEPDGTPNPPSDLPEKPENETNSDAPDSPGESLEGSLFDRLSPDDLLFVGAMLYLLSGKSGNDSFLLLAYLLTCGL